MKPTVPEKAKRAVVPRVRKPDKAILRLIDRTTINFDVAKSITALAMLVGATKVQSVAGVVMRSLGWH